ncbi:carboxypeptidase regulatory-like domain-containing protein [bacterium SCSIO 12741]|nr:carboxypeptidase regulatory-like domain-containing protein [bacterium SCSIO 12741]
MAETPIETGPQELRLEGQLVNKSNQAMAGVPIVLMEKGKRLEADTTDPNGNYALSLPFMKEALTVQVNNDTLHPTFIELNTMLPEGTDPNADTLSIAAIPAFSINDPDANPEAFKKPYQVYDYEQGNFLVDPAAADEFKATLNIIPDYRLIAVEGRARDTKNKNISDARVVVLENGSPVDTVFTDKKGRYELSLDYQKSYKFSVQKDGYKSSYVAISTQTATNNERLVGKKIKGLNLLLVNDDVQNVNSPTLSRPYARYAYDQRKDEFIEVKSVRDEFMAELFIEEEKKKEVQLTTEEVAVVVETGEKGLSDELKIGVTESNEAVEKRKQNKSQAAKNAVMGDFHTALAGLNVGPRRSLKDVNLALENILNTGYEVTSSQNSELDESMLSAVENRQLLSEIVAGLGLKRGDVEPVSLDSTFNLHSRARIYHSEEGLGVYLVYRDKVYRPGEVVEYVKEVDWWLFDSYYRNNEKISSEEYEKELASLRASGHVFDLQIQEEEDS